MKVLLVISADCSIPKEASQMDFFIHWYCYWSDSLLTTTIRHLRSRFVYLSSVNLESKKTKRKKTKRKNQKEKTNEINAGRPLLRTAWPWQIHLKTRCPTWGKKRPPSEMPKSTSCHEIGNPESWMNAGNLNESSPVNSPVEKQKKIRCNQKTGNKGRILIHRGVNPVLLEGELNETKPRANGG